MLGAQLVNSAGGGGDFWSCNVNDVIVMSGLFLRTLEEGLQQMVALHKGLIFLIFALEVSCVIGGENRV